MPTPDQIASTIRSASKEQGDLPLEVAYFGGTFTALQKEEQVSLLEPAFASLQQGVLSGIRVSTHPAFTTAETMALLTGHGVTTVELGIQSFSTSVLAHNRRTYSGEEALQACRIVQDCGLDLVVQLMPFLPLAEERQDLEAARLVAKLNPSGVRLFPTVVLQGTTLEDWWREGSWQPPSVDATAGRVAKMLYILLTAGVTVHRIGLQSSHSLDEAVLAGPYHPALGELCRSALLADVLGSAMGQMQLEGADRPEIIADPAVASLLTGHNHFGLRLLRDKHPAQSFDWRLRTPQTSGYQRPKRSFWRSEVFSVSLDGRIVHVVRG